MDISKALCTSCGQGMGVVKMFCPTCNLTLEGDFEIPALARLSPEDQLFVTAFIRDHGSIKKMEALFGISYPTVKNRLNAVASKLDASFHAPASNAEILERLSRGEITVDEALERLQ